MGLLAENPHIPSGWKTPVDHGLPPPFWGKVFQRPNWEWTWVNYLLAKFFGRNWKRKKNIWKHLRSISYSISVHSFICIFNPGRSSWNPLKKRGQFWYPPWNEQPKPLKIDGKGRRSFPSFWGPKKPIFRHLFAIVVFGEGSAIIPRNHPGKEKHPIPTGKFLSFQPLHLVLTGTTGTTLWLHGGLVNFLPLGGEN